MLADSVLSGQILEHYRNTAFDMLLSCSHWPIRQRPDFMVWHSRIPLSNLGRLHQLRTVSAECGRKPKINMIQTSLYMEVSSQYLNKGHRLAVQGWYDNATQLQELQVYHYVISSGSCPPGLIRWLENQPSHTSSRYQDRRREKEGSEENLFYFKGLSQKFL